MTHCPEHKHLDWHKYIRQKVANRTEYEDALAGCPHCLEMFYLALESDLLSPPEGFTDGVIAGLEAQQQQARPSPLRPLLHFAVAASLTLVLIRLGFFDYMLQFSQQPSSQGYLAEFLERLHVFLGHLKI